MTHKLIPYELGEQLHSPQKIAAFLNARLEEAPGDITRAKGLSQVARDAGLSRGSLSTKRSARMAIRALRLC